MTKLLAVVACFGLAATSHAQTSAQATGNWSDVATWSNGIPATGVQTNIAGDYSVTLNSGTATAGLVSIGNVNGQTGTLTVSGSGTTLTMGNGLGHMGNSNGGTGTLNVTDGAAVTQNGNFRMAANASGTAVISVSDGSSLTFANQLQASEAGDTTINVSGGSTLKATHINIGRGTKINLIGSGSTMFATGNVTMAGGANAGATIHFGLEAAGSSIVRSSGGVGIGLDQVVLEFSTLAGFENTSLTSFLLFEVTGSGSITNFDTLTVGDWGGLDQNFWKLVMSEDSKQLNLVYQIPEPGTTALLLGAATLLGVCVVRRRKKA